MVDKNITNIVGTSKMTRNGQVFSPPPPPPKETNSEALDKARGKKVMANQPGLSMG